MENYIRNFIISKNLIPDNVFRHEVKMEDSSSINELNFKYANPHILSSLINFPLIEYTITLFNVQQASNIVLNYENNAVYNSFKPILPFTNAMKSIKLTINQEVKTLVNPRNYFDALNVLYVSEGDDKKYSAFGVGKHWALNGQFLDLGAQSPGLISDYRALDTPLYENELAFRSKLFRSNFATLTGTNSHSITCQEFLVIPPFNPYGIIKESLPDYSIFKHLPDMLDNIRNVDIEIKFDKLAPSILFPKYTFGINAGLAIGPEIRITALSAKLILYFYKYPTIQRPLVTSNININKMNYMNYWSVQSYINNIGSLATNTLSEQKFEIDICKVPSLILIFARVNQDSSSYNSLYYFWDVDQAGGDFNANINENALDSYCEIRNLSVDLGTISGVINTKYSQEELYNITNTNANLHGIAYDFERWRGQIINQDFAADAIIFNACKCFIALRPHNLGLNPSLFNYSNRIRLTITVQFYGRHCAYAFSNGTTDFNAHAHVFY